MKWFGYRHINGTFQVKRALSFLDYQEAKKSPFVARIYGPWDVNSRDEALQMLRKEFRNTCLTRK